MTIIHFLMRALGLTFKAVLLVVFAVVAFVFVTATRQFARTS